MLTLRCWSFAIVCGSTVREELGSTANAAPKNQAAAGTARAAKYTNAAASAAKFTNAAASAAKFSEEVGFRLLPLGEAQARAQLPLGSPTTRDGDDYYTPRATPGRGTYVKIKSKIK